jgi:hypothetical protein
MKPATVDPPCAAGQKSRRKARAADALAATGIAPSVGAKRMTERDAAQSPAAMRMRRSRERRLEGLRCLRVELRATEIDALIRKGLLKSEARNERKAILQALYAFLEDNLDGPP